MMFKKTLLATAMIALGGFALNASAASQTTTFQVTATVVNNCVISSTNIAFGNYDPTSATALTASGNVSAKCTKNDVVYVELGQGLNPGAGSTAAVPVRQMKSGANLLPYDIYTTAAGTTEWGTGVANRPASQTSLSVNTALNFQTNGSLPAGTDVPSGSYTDSVVATVTY
ncbi:MAG: spore coat U domain-containing protein [Rhodanobacter sp.]